MKTIKNVMLMALLLAIGYITKAQQVCQVIGFQAQLDSNLVSFDIDTAHLSSVDSVEFLIYSTSGAFWGCRGDLQTAYQTLLSSSGTHNPNSFYCVVQNVFNNGNFICQDSACVTAVPIGNAAPVANDDYFTTSPATPIVMNVLQNDYDPNGDALTVYVGVSPLYGTVVVNPDYSITYSPNPGMTSCDWFTYTICDASACDTATVEVCTQPSNCQMTAIIITDSSNTTASALANGGTAPFTYSWSNGSTTSSINSGLPNNPYCVTITDANGCTATDCEDTISGGCNLVAVISVGTNPAGETTLSAVATLGTMPYLYSWNNGITSFVQTIVATVPGVYCVTVTDQNNCSATACYAYQGNCFDTICGAAFFDSNNNGVFDGNEQPHPNAIIIVNNTTIVTDSSGNYELIVPCNQNTLYIQAYDPDSTGLLLVTFPTNGYYVYVDTNITSPHRQCGFNFAFSSDFITISGVVYNDANGNGIKDATENGLPYQSVQVGGATSYTDYAGHYSLILALGSHNVSYTPSGWYAGYSYSPTAGYSINGTTGGQSFGNNNFGVVVPAGSVNLAVDIIPHTTVTPGFPAWYHIQVCNVGATPVASTLNMFYDAALTYFSSSPIAASHNSSTNTITWNVPTLAPGQCQYYWADFDAPTIVALGYNAINLVNVLPISGTDVYMANNVDTTHQIAVGSWDPNNKLPEESNYAVNPNLHQISSINSNQWIDYVINFQNTGTAPAVNVVIKDIISTDLDISTLQFTASSHPCVVTKSGNEMNYKFSGIMLPDSGSNEAASHGFVKFRIKAKDNLAVGHIISDEAAIYFDFNSPVITNDAAVTLLGASGIEDGTLAATVSVQPNPVQSFTTIKLSDSNTDGFTFAVYDIAGRKVATQEASGNELKFERVGLTTGVYLYQVEQNGKTVAKGKLILQ